MLTGYGKYRVNSSSTQRKFESKGSSLLGTPGAGTSGSFGLTGHAMSGDHALGMVEGLIDLSSTQMLNKIYRDMYYHDTVCGSAVDLYSNLPFSDFSLSGVDNSSILEKFTESIEQLRLKTLLPGISVDYHVLGAFVGSLNFDSEEKIFTNITPHNLDNCMMTPVPIYGVDPIIDLKVDENLKDIITNNDPRYAAIKKLLPLDVIKAGKKGLINLQPSNTLYIPRRSFSTETIGMSLFRRILPIYVMEKALARGTIDQVYRRQRSIMHIIAGDSQTWTPNEEELTAISNLFQSADMDPVNAIIATRDGIQVQDVKRGDDFWKWTDVYDQFSSMKLRALGVNASFLEGDATYNTLETSLSVFIEQMRATREAFTRELFYDKMFPMIAYTNDFKKSKRALKVTSESEPENYYNSYGSRIIADKNGNLHSIVADIGGIEIPDGEKITDYWIPTVNWHKRLKPEADREYLDILRDMEERGVPVPIRTLAAAAGLNIEEIIGQFDDDISLREQVADYFKELKKLKPKDDEDGGFDGGFASYIANNKVNNGGSIIREGLGNRHLQEGALGPYETDKLGRPKEASAKRKRELTERLDKYTALFCSEKAKKENHVEKEKQWKNRKPQVQTRK